MRSAPGTNSRCGARWVAGSCGRGTRPRCCVGGGHSGVVPLMSMLRQARRSGAADRVHLVLCVGTAAGLYYADELPGPDTTIMYMYQAPASDPRAAWPSHGARHSPHARGDAHLHLRHVIVRRHRDGSCHEGRDPGRPNTDRAPLAIGHPLVLSHVETDVVVRSAAVDENFATCDPTCPYSNRYR